MITESPSGTRTIPTDVEDAYYLLWRKPTIDVDVAALLVGVSAQTIYKTIRDSGMAFDGVPALKIKRRYVIPTEPLRTFLHCTVEPNWS